MSTRMRMRIHNLLPNLHGINIKEAKKLWLLAGGEYYRGRQNGETYFHHPHFGIYKCGRGKSCPRELSTRLRVLLLMVVDREEAAHV